MGQFTLKCQNAEMPIYVDNDLIMDGKFLDAFKVFLSARLVLINVLCIGEILLC